jgi:hypothetical protein
MNWGAKSFPEDSNEDVAIRYGENFIDQTLRAIPVKSWKCLRLPSAHGQQHAEVVAHATVELSGYGFDGLPLLPYIGRGSNHDSEDLNVNWHRDALEGFSFRFSIMFFGRINSLINGCTVVVVMSANSER